MKKRAPKPKKVAPLPTTTRKPKQQRPRRSPRRRAQARPPRTKRAQARPPRTKRTQARPPPTKRAKTEPGSPPLPHLPSPSILGASTSRPQTASPVTFGPFGKALVFDPDFKGPIRGRQCTDVICLFLFIAFISGWASIAVFAYIQGRPETLVFPTDTEGNICGQGSKKKEKFLYFFDLTKCSEPNVLFTGCHTPQVCVKKCPSKTASVYRTTLDGAVYIDDSLKDLLICKYGVNKTQKEVKDLLSEEECGDIYFNSVPLIERCLPDALSQDRAGNILDFKNRTMSSSMGKTLKMSTVLDATRFLAQFLSAKEVGQKMFMDVETSWHLILIGLVFSMFLSVTWTLFMRWLPAIMVWTSVVVVYFFSVYACYYSAMVYIEIDEQKYNMSEPQKAFSFSLRSYLALKNTWMAFAIISGLVLAILSLMLIFLRRRLFIAVEMIKLACSGIKHMMSSLFFPTIPYLIQVMMVAFWASVSVYLASSGRAEFKVHNAPNNSEFVDGSRCDPTTWSNKNGECLFFAYGAGNLFLHEQLYNLFGLIWALFFVAGITQITISGAFSSYYWAKRKPEDLPEFPIFLSLCRAVRFHSGSAAFGALLLAFAGNIIAVLEYIDKKLKKFNNKMAKKVLWCYRCCFCHQQNCIYAVKKNAYIMVAIYGKDFCESAKNAFRLLMRNILSVVLLGKVTDFLLLFGKLVVVGPTALLSFHFFSGHSEYMGKYLPDLNYNLLPVMIIVAGSYFIASTYFSVYGMAVDTLFFCFLEDIERNDGSSDRPYYMSKELMMLLNKNYKEHPVCSHRS